MVKKILRIFIKIILWFIGLSVGSVIVFRFVPVPVTPLMLIRCVEQKSGGKSMKLIKDWTPINEMSAAMPLAVIASEDQNFEEHFGF
ncbi:MAG TPA: monofunctional biosynthetic peptidoglycan transglycosylase, partial [Bacteroidia bacterium]|nr:monofunctional biosynthetic peptidoglycan transglycosylase [Bacteroidia bacterium]